MTVAAEPLERAPVDPVGDLAAGLSALITTAVREALDRPVAVDDQALTVEQAAEHLAVGPDVVYRAIAAGQLPALRIGRSYRLSRRRLNELMHEGDSCDSTH